MISQERLNLWSEVSYSLWFSFIFGDFESTAQDFQPPPQAPFGPMNISEKNTPQKTNMSPESQWLEDVFPIKVVPF